MLKSLKSLILKNIAQIREFVKKYTKTVLLPLAVLSALIALPLEASAAVELPFISGIGCTFIQYLKGPLAVVIFMGVLVATIIVGMIAKMDWAKIISLVVLFGFLQGLSTILLNTGYISIPSCML